METLKIHVDKEEMNKREMMQLIKKLHDVQKKLSIPKDKVNEFGKFKYRNAEGILEALKEVIPEDCITYSSINFEEGKEVIVESFTDGASIISARMVMPPIEPKRGMSIEQSFGARLSYARKYVLGMLYAIDDSKDDPDSKDWTETEPGKPYSKAVSRVQEVFGKPGTEPQRETKKPSLLDKFE
jgi:hypothetical protein